jgi:hypothetical protein
MEHVNIEITGKFNQYAILTAEQGYCFYDVNEEERNYLTQIYTPVADIAELEKTYVAVLGCADVLNEQLEKEKEEYVADKDVEDIEGGEDVV